MIYFQSAVATIQPEKQQELVWVWQWIIDDQYASSARKFRIELIEPRE